MSANDSAPAALGWRLLAMLYDAVPLLPIALLVSATALAVNGGEPVAGTVGRLAMAFATWLAGGAYFVLSWRHGGQTMGMRPWRLRVVAASGARLSTAAAWTRYAVATLALACAGLGLLWSLFDRERRAWQDLASGTRLVREPRT
jgi:uncharacterized RDD family membrane protein YckC